MRCEGALALASLASRGELDNRKAESLREHLAGCESCRRAAKQAASLDGALRTTLRQPPIAIDLRPAVMRRLPAPRPEFPWIAAPRRRVRSRRLGVAGAGFAAAAVVAAVGWFGLHHRPAVTTPRPTAVTHHPEPAIATLISAPGAVTVEGGAPGERALHAGDRLRTADKAGARIELSDGTKLDLSPSTRVQLQPTGLALTSGRVLAQVAPQHQDFVIQTPQAQARVLGTLFTVETRDGDTTLVTVARGAVRVANGAGETIVPAGTFTAARAGLAPLPAEEIDTVAVLDSGDSTSHPASETDLADEIDATRRAILAQKWEVQALRDKIGQASTGTKR